MAQQSVRVGNEDLVHLALDRVLGPEPHLVSVAARTHHAMEAAWQPAGVNALLQRILFAGFGLRRGSAACYGGARAMARTGRNP